MMVPRVLILSNGKPAGAALGLLGACGVAFGLWMLLAKYVAELDRERRSFVQTWSAGIRLRRRETPLDGYTAVAIRSQLGRTRYSYYLYATTMLVGPRGELPLRSGHDPDAVVRLAHEIGGFLGLPVRDERKSFEQLRAERPGLTSRRTAMIVGITMGGLALLAIVTAVAVVVGMKQSAPSPSPAPGGGSKPRRARAR
jgi:hypothetical protein